MIIRMDGQVRERTRRVTRTLEVNVARDAVTRAYDVHELEVAPLDGSFAFETTVTGTDLLSLETTRCTGTVRGEVDTHGDVVVTWVKSGHGVVDGDELLVGRPVLYREGRQTFSWRASNSDTLRIDRETVERVAAARGGWEPGPLEFKPHHVPDGAPLAAWWLLVRTVAAEVLGHVGTVTEERERELTSFAAAGLLTAIPHWPVGRDGEAPPTTRLGKAEAFLLDHVAERIEIADVAHAAGLSVRGLQVAFQRVHGVSPTDYLRGVRLLLAREDLRSGSASTVGEAARRVGLHHVGRFAIAYKEEFGESPRDVLRTARLRALDAG